MERVPRLALEHRVQQGRRHVREVGRREVILKGLDSYICFTFLCTLHMQVRSMNEEDVFILYYAI